MSIPVYRSAYLTYACLYLTLVDNYAHKTTTEARRYLCAPPAGPPLTPLTPWALSPHPPAAPGAVPCPRLPPHTFPSPFPLHPPAGRRARVQPGGRGRAGQGRAAPPAPSGRRRPGPSAPRPPPSPHRRLGRGLAAEGRRRRRRRGEKPGGPGCRGGGRG